MKNTSSLGSSDLIKSEVMKAAHHLHIFYLATTFWTLFFLGGLSSNYYQDWHWALSLILILIIPTYLYYFFCTKLVNNLLAYMPKFKAAVWLALYFTAPFFIYDLIYLGYHQKLGLSFIRTHWYLSLFYLVPWLMIFPLSKEIQSRNKIIL